MKKQWELLAVVLLGFALGNVVGYGCSKVGVMPWLGYHMIFGTIEPAVLDLGAISFNFGIQIYISIAGCIGGAIAVSLYKLGNKNDI